MSLHLFFLFPHRIFKSMTLGIADENAETNDTYRTAYLSPQLMMVVDWYHYGAHKQFRGIPTCKQWRNKKRKLLKLGIQLIISCWSQTDENTFIFKSSNSCFIIYLKKTALEEGNTSRLNQFKYSLFFWRPEMLPLLAREIHF